MQGPQERNQVNVGNLRDEWAKWLRILSELADEDFRSLVNRLSTMYGLRLREHALFELADRVGTVNGSGETLALLFLIGGSESMRDELDYPTPLARTRLNQLASAYGSTIREMAEVLRWPRNWAYVRFDALTDSDDTQRVDLSLVTKEGGTFTLEMEPTSFARLLVRLLRASRDMPPGHTAKLEHDALTELVEELELTEAKFRSSS